MSETNFTARDFEILARAMKCNENDVKINYKQLAELGGYANSNSAKAAWHGLKKKIEKVGDGASVSTSMSIGEGDEATETPKSASGKKRKAATKPADEDGEATPSKAAKKGRKPRAKAKAAAAPEEADDEEEVPSAAVKEEAADVAEGGETEKEEVKKENEEEEA